MTEVHGYCDERFALLHEMFQDNLATGIDTGGSVAATLHGEPVVDLWGGHSDWAFEQPWAEDTICHVFSTAKLVAIITLLLLVDRAQLDLDTPVAAYWPEFGEHGKETITTRQVLVHTSGLPGFGRSVSWDEFLDFDRMVELVAAAKPWYEPGSTTHYSFFASGFVIGELVRRVTGQGFRDFFRTELAEPLGADFHFGTDDPAVHERVAALWPPEDAAYDSDPAFDEVEQGDWLAPECMAALMPAVNALTNARALARIGSVMAAGGTVDERHYLSPETIAEAGTEQSYDHSPFLGWCRFGLGFGLDHPDFPAPTPTTMHWGGYGGSWLTMDPATGLSTAFVPNKLRVGEPGKPWDDRNERFTRVIGEISRTLS